MSFACINSLADKRAHTLAVVRDTPAGTAATCPTCSHSWLLTTAERAQLETAKEPCK